MTDTPPLITPSTTVSTTTTLPSQPVPAWVRLIPSTRSIVTFLMFMLAWRMLEMIDAEPALLHESSFVGLATLIIGGSGLGAAVAFFYGAAHTLADKPSASTTTTTESH
jgi:hypothetical protein